MASKRTYLKFRKDADETYMTDSSLFTGAVITVDDADNKHITLSFKAQDGTADADKIKLNLATNALTDFRDFCHVFAGALAGHTISKGIVTVADHTTGEVLKGAKLDTATATSAIDSITA